MSIDVVSHFTNIRLLADIFNRSSGFDQLNYGDVLMLSGFAPIFPDTCYHLTHYWPAAADIPV
ncbi:MULTISPECIES: hypothetical protein, partial [unclassified Salmonella]|uniref:hypothetical protein n=1 Tax=unclassified Salmonella TaxID=2614656 RepID=UPI003F6C3963